MSQLLRKLVDQARSEIPAEGITAEKRDKVALFAGAARFFKLGGVVTLGDDLSLEEIEALDSARIIHEAEELGRLAEALQAPFGLGRAIALRRIDGGRALERAVLELAAKKKEGPAS